jgi:hypothetical protein
MKKSGIFLGVSCAAATVILFWPRTSDGVGENRSREDLENIKKSQLQNARHMASGETTKSYLQTKEWLNSLEEVKSVYGRDPESQMQFLTSDGDVDKVNLAATGLSDSQIREVDESIQLARKSMADFIVSQLQTDHECNDPDKKIFAYVVKANRQVGDVILNRLHSELMAICGEPLGIEIYRGLRLSSQYGCFGRQDLKIRMSEMDGADMMSVMEIRGYAPDAGVLVMKGRISTPGDLKYFFEGVFQFE